MARSYMPNLNTEEIAWIVGSERHAHSPGGWRQPGPEFVGQKWFFKELSSDDRTGAVTLLFRHTGGLCYPAAGYHPVFEESFLIQGSIMAFEDSPFVPSPYRKGCYFFRPPGWIHDSEMTAETHTLILRMTDGQDARIPSEWGSIGRNALLNANAAVEPRGYIRCLNSNDLPWTGAYEFLSLHAWELDLAHVPRSKLWFKLLSKDGNIGAATVLVRMEERFMLPTAGYYTVSQEAYVLEGELAVGERVLKQGSYVYRPSGFVEGPIEAMKDSVLFCRYGGTVKRVDRPLTDVDMNVLGERAPEGPGDGR